MPTTGGHARFQEEKHSSAIPARGHGVQSDELVVKLYKGEYAVRAEVLQVSIGGQLAPLQVYFRHGRPCHAFSAVCG